MKETLRDFMLRGKPNDTNCENFLSLQNALAATAAPFQGQYTGFEAYPYASAATGESSLQELSLSNHFS